MLSHKAKKAIELTISGLEFNPGLWQQGINGALMEGGKVPNCVGVLLTRQMRAQWLEGSEANEPSSACSAVLKEQVTVWNDQPGRTVADCVQLLRRVLEEGQS